MKLLKAGKVITGIRGQVIHHGAVLVSEDNIVAVGSQNEVCVPDGAKAEVVDLQDMTLLPGLIDCHVHLGLNASSDPAGPMMHASDQQLMAQMLHHAGMLLRSGVTTARELGARNYLDLAVKEAIELGFAEGPNLLVSNRPITSTGGHCWFMGCECDDPVSLKRAVREHVKAGADLIKVMATGGNLTRGSVQHIAQFSLEEMQTLTYEAHTLGKKVASHAHGTPGIRNSVEAGVDTIEHCSWLSHSGIDYDERLAEKIVEQGIYICPTTNAKWKTNRSRRESRMPQLKRMRELGMKFIYGTDAGIATVPHDKYVDGLEVLKEIGMSNEDILESATSLAAEGLGIHEVTGTLTPGKRADLIAVKGNPLHDLASLRNIAYVMRAGKVPAFVFGIRHDY